MLQFVDIESASDELLIPWIELYEIAFPPEERILVAQFLKLLHAKARGEYAESHIQAVVDKDGRFVALLRYDLIRDRKSAYLWYLAVHPDARSGGIGAQCFAHVVSRAEEAGLRALVWEVEMPEHLEDETKRELARRRIAFYRRQGALMLTGIHYIQQVAYQPGTPMHIMVRPIEQVTPQEVFELANRLLGGVEQVGELGLS